VPSSLFSTRSNVSLSVLAELSRHAWKQVSVFSLQRSCFPLKPQTIGSNVQEGHAVLGPGGRPQSLHHTCLGRSEGHACHAGCRLS
jgi:hypothetical protein